MNRLKVAFLDLWPGFAPNQFTGKYREFDAAVAAAGCAGVDIVADARAADLVVFSCFPGGRRTTRPRDPRTAAGARGVRLFWTGENVRPDFSTCDFALSFDRELVDPRHLRVPNYVGNHRLHGFPDAALLEPPADAAALRRGKTRFCAYVQRNRVPAREAFVQALARHRRVDCGGPSLNNLQLGADRGAKYPLYRESKFVVAFENEAGVGYTSEKLPDALVAGSVPIYWGDPTVDLDFDPGCFLHRRDFSSDAALIERILALDRDDAAYERILAAPRAPRRRLADGTDPALLRVFLEKVVRAAVAPRAALETSGVVT
jgi:hypothetical protein